MATQLDTAEITGTAIGFFLVGIIIALALALRGVAVSLLWGWFGVPLGLPAISIAHGLGLALLGSALRGHPQRATEADKSWKATAVLFYAPALLIAVGWLVKELFL